MCKSSQVVILKSSHADILDPKENYRSQSTMSSVRFLLSNMYMSVFRWHGGVIVSTVNSQQEGSGFKFTSSSFLPQSKDLGLG